MELGTFTWRCHTCGNQHSGLPLDFAYDEPEAYRALTEAEKKNAFLNADFCAIPEHDWYFVRGLIALPVVGAQDEFRWGVWSSLSKKNFDFTNDHWDDPNCAQYPPMFGWLNSRIEGYPDTLSLKLSVRLRADTRPFFEVEPSDHPLAVQQRNGITLEQIQQIAARHH